MILFCAFGVNRWHPAALVIGGPLERCQPHLLADAQLVVMGHFSNACASCPMQHSPTSLWPLPHLLALFSNSSACRQKGAMSILSRTRGHLGPICAWPSTVQLSPAVLPHFFAIIPSGWNPQALTWLGVERNDWQLGHVQTLPRTVITNNTPPSALGRYSVIMTVIYLKNISE